MAARHRFLSSTRRTRRPLVDRFLPGVRQTRGHAVGAGRYATAVEGAAYFVVSEALANVAKYSEAQRADVRADWLDDELTVEIADDGVGGADPSAGSGLRGLADRLASVNGRLEITSPVGGGTRLLAHIPAAAPTAALL